jgi:hypothetical protein
MRSADSSERIKVLPPRLRVAHLRALIRRAPAGSARFRKLAVLLHEELTAPAANENRAR